MDINELLNLASKGDTQAIKILVELGYLHASALAA